MISEERAEKILAELKSLSVEQRLNALNDAKGLFREAFKADMSIKEYAYSAKVIEQYYNLIREELRVNQIRIKTSDADTELKPKTKAKAKTKAKTKVNPEMDMAKLLEAFKAFKENQ